MTKDWSSLREEIRQLYHVENKPLNEVMRVIKGRHGFQACERSYRNQLRKWGYAKYSTESCPRPPGHSRNGRSTARAKGRQTMRLPAVAPTAIEASHQDSHEENTAIRKLRQTILFGDRLSVQSLLHGGAPVNIIDNYGNVPLYYAIEKRRLQVVQDLIRFGADVSLKDQRQRSLLHSLAQAENKARLERVQEFVDALIVVGADPSPQDVDGNTPLHLAIPVSISIVEKDRASSPNENPKTRTFVDVLLEHKPDLNLRNNYGISPFELLIKNTVNKSSCQYIRHFLRFGVDLAQSASSGNSLFYDFLTKSMEPGSTLDTAKDAICLFLQLGADPNTVLPSGEPIIRSLLRPDSEFDFKDTIRLLRVMRGVSTVWDDGNTIAHDLCFACACRDVRNMWKRDIQSLIDTILGVGSNRDRRNKKGQTPLLLVSASKYSSNAVFDVMTALLQAGSDPFAQDLFGECPVIEVARWASGKHLETFLNADLQRREQSNYRSSKNASRAIEAESMEQRLYWEDWELAAEATDWDTARLIAFNPKSFLEADVDEKLRKCALVVLATKHASLVTSVVAEEGNLPSRKETLRKELSSILRDYRVTGSWIPVAWVDMLLELS